MLTKTVKMSDYGPHGRPRPKREIIVQLDRLTALRERLVKIIKLLQTPLSDALGLVDKKLLKSEQTLCQSSIDAAKKDLQTVDKQIGTLIEADAQLKELFDIVDSVKGIGQVIATEVLITTNEFKDIRDSKKYACYAGFAPFEHSSGKYKGKSKVSNKANKKVKALFHNAAMSAIQHCKEIKDYYQRKVAEGKHKMLVINNICNKLVLRIFACVSRREKFQTMFQYVLSHSITKFTKCICQMLEHHNKDAASASNSTIPCAKV